MSYLKHKDNDYGGTPGGRAPGISIQRNKAPPLKRPTFTVDGKLDDKLDEYEITKLLNRSNFTLFLGRAGSGKTSMIVSLLNTPELFKKVYHNVFLFMGKNSRDSIKGSFFDRKIAPDDIFDELTEDNLEVVYNTIMSDSEEGYRSLIIMDDVQKSLKDHEVQKMLLHIVNNRRHLKTSIWCANQNYINLPRSVRMGLTDMFVWKVNKREMENIFSEQIEQHKDKFQDVLKLLYKEPHDFFYLNTNSQRMFNNWDEIIIEE
jgi:GTPase SAR1 family protein